MPPSKASFVILLSAVVVYAVAFWHGTKHNKIKWEQAEVSAGYWSERTNLHNLKEALEALDRDNNPKAFDSVAWGYCRSVVALSNYRKAMDPSFWDLATVDDDIGEHKAFIAGRPSIQEFAKTMKDGPDVAPFFRKSTYTNLFSEIKIQGK